MWPLRRPRVYRPRKTRGGGSLYIVTGRPSSILKIFRCNLLGEEHASLVTNPQPYSVRKSNKFSVSQSEFGGIMPPFVVGTLGKGVKVDYLSWEII